MRASRQWQGWLQILLGLTLTYLFFYMMAPFLVALFLGAVLAIICYPVYTKLGKWIPGPLAALALTLGTTVGFLVPIVFLLYNGIHRLLSVMGKLRLPTEGTLEHLLNQPTVSRILNLLTRFSPVDKDWLRNQSFEVLQNVLEKSAQIGTSFLGSMPSLMLGFIVVILSIFFFMVDGANFLRFLSSLSPLGSDRTAQLYNSFEKSCRGVVLGLFLSSLLQGFLAGVFFIVTGLPSPVLAATATFIMGMVPVVGSAPIWVGAVLYLFFSNEVLMATIMLIGGLLITSTDNVVRTLVMKGQSAMHPLLGLVSVFGAVNLFGPMGIFLGPIIAAVFISFLKIITLEIQREGSRGAH